LERRSKEEISKHMPHIAVSALMGGMTAAAFCGRRRLLYKVEREYVRWVKEGFRNIRILKSLGYLVCM
jgi:hypothetical protein